MTAEQLKASILQMAIEGRLVPQRDDEPAVDIAGEEPEDVPFAIPEKWKWVRLGELIKIISGTSYKKNDVSTSGLRIIRGGNIQNNKVVLCDDDVFLPVSFLDKNKTVQKGDIVIVSSTGSEKVIGKPGVYVGNETIQIGAFLRILRPKNIEFYEYLRVIITSDYYRGHIREVAKGTNIRNIKAEYITDLPLPLPPLAEQRRIVARLEELLPLVEEYGNAHAALKKTEEALPDQLRASLLQEAIQGKLVPQIDDEPAVDIAGEEPEEVPFAIPAKWRWVSLGDAVVYGKAEQSVGKDIPKEAWVLDLEDIQKKCGIILQKKRNVASTSNKSRFYKGNVLYSKLRPYLNKVVVADEDWYCTTEIVPIDPRSNGYEIDADYLKVYLMSPYFVHYAMNGRMV